MLIRLAPNEKRFEMSQITATALLALAPLGAFIEYCDGTPRPPERFKHKLAAWKGTNDCGHFVAAHPGNPSKSWDPPRFILQRDYGHIIFNKMFGVGNDQLHFKVTPPKPGTILPYSEFEGTIEVKHVWPDIGAARAWARGNYKFSNCGYRYLIVTDEGALTEHIMPEQ
jgi:hypothetical protein